MNVMAIHCVFRGGKDFFVLVLEQLMFVKGTGKHWCKYPTTQLVVIFNCMYMYVCMN